MHMYSYIVSVVIYLVLAMCWSLNLAYPTSWVEFCRVVRTVHALFPGYRTLMVPLFNFFPLLG